MLKKLVISCFFLILPTNHTFHTLDCCLVVEAPLFNSIVIVMQDKITKQNKKTCEVAMYGTVTVGSKGQIVIPKDVRTKLGIESGESLIVLTKGKAI